MCAQRFDGVVEFIFIDGCSEDGTPTVLRELAGEDRRIRLFENPRRLAAPALNIGLAEARGEFVARMDAHTYYPPDYLARGVARLRRGDVAWVSGPQLAYGVNRSSRRVALALGSRLGSGRAAFRRRCDREIEVDSGFTGVTRRSTLEAHGGWDADASPNEDAELAARIREAGGRIVCVPEMAARYVPRERLGALARQYWRFGLYRARTSHLHPRSMRPSHLLPPALVLALLASVFAPARLARGPRIAAGTYAATLLAGSARAARGAGWREAVLLPAVFATMHLSWGLGVLVGAARFGAPLGAPGALARRLTSTAAAAQCPDPSD
jgi:cellulose synthase/poly-beta-1,6-N-acetylglucosamine synthase-like glycosyltransferase